MADLCLAVKKEYFEQIKSGEKRDEFRLCNDYWNKRIIGKDFDTVTITLGYPTKDDEERRIVFDWDGCFITKIRHKQFDNELHEVFAISLRGKRR